MAHKDVLEILANQRIKGTIHCFTGNWEEAQKYIDLGFYLGINGIIFKLDLNEVIEKYSTRQNYSLKPIVHI